MGAAKLPRAALDIRIAHCQKPGNALYCLQNRYEITAAVIQVCIGVLYGNKRFEKR